MSLPKSTTRRAALLSSASLVAAAITSAASLAVVLTPGAAMAQAVCSETQAEVSDPADDTVTCPGGTYPTGINYTTTGDLSLTVTGAQLSPATPTVSNFGTGGIVATAGGASDDIILRLTGTTASSSISYNTAFPALLNAESQSGDVTVEIDIDRAFGAPTISASNAATTRGVRAVSTAGGDVTVRNLSSGSNAADTRNSFSATGAPLAVAIEATSIGGGDVEVDLGQGSATGRLYGILAQTDGAGGVTITGTGLANTTLAGSAGLRVVAGTGPVSIVGGLDGFNRSNAFTGRTGVYVDAGGDVTFTGLGNGTDYGIDIVNVAAGTTTTLNLHGVVQTTTGAALQSTRGGIAAIRAQGAGTLDINIIGAQQNLNFDFAGMSERVEVGVSGGGAWVPLANTATTISGNFSMNIAEDGALISGWTTGSNVLEPATVLTFSDPAMVLNNAGYIIIGPDDRTTGGQRRQLEAELRIVGLNEFRHSGTVLLGGGGVRATASQFIQGAKLVTDGWYDDLLVFQGGTWIGEGGRIVFDVDTERTQTACVREAVTFDFPAADCVRFVDATIEGLTYITLNQQIAGDRGRLNQQLMDEGVTLIEVQGSTTVSADNFALDPELPGFNPITGTLDKGLFQYALLFDEGAGQFRLFPTLTGAAYQLPMAATAAHNLWRVSTGSWLNRQADLRGSMPEELGGGIWLRASGEQTDREITSVSTLGGLPYAVDSNHRADTYAINGGVDIFSGSDGNIGYVVGLTAGYAHSDIEYETSTNTQAMDAWTGGIYGGLVVGQLFVDAIVNANNVIIDTDAPGFNLQPEGTIVSSRMISLGGQVEAGWRMLFDGGLFLEPIASVSYVRSKMDDLEIQPDDQARPGLAVQFEDPSSFRAGVGGRFGIDTNFAGMRTQASLLARTWQDLEGQNTAAIHNLAFPDDPDIRVVDEFSDQFHEVAVGASVWAPNGLVSGFLNLGGKWGEGYEAKTGSVGVRVAW